MKGKTSVLHSNYIIDGVRKNATPGEILASACETETIRKETDFEPIVDESIDAEPFAHYPSESPKELLEKVKSVINRPYPIRHSGEYAKLLISRSLTKEIWQDGHFRLGDLRPILNWKWNSNGVGSMAALYESVENASSYIDELGLKLASYSIGENETNALDCSFLVHGSEESGEKAISEEDFFSELPFQTEHPVLSKERKCPSEAICKEGDWLIYIPFDTCNFNLGASALEYASGLSLGKTPELESPDYFIDCYEVVRELVEDGIILSGIEIKEGGLLAALDAIVPEGKGIKAELGDILRSYGEKESLRILFSEVPGVLIEIPDEDYDYIDAELLLQDVAYYPLGHIGSDCNGVEYSVSDHTYITDILHSLLNGQVSEGED